MYNFEEIMNRSNNGSMKWDIDYIKKRFPGVGDEVYPFFIADMDYKLPKEIISSFNDFVSVGDFGYFHVSEGFKESIIKWNKNIHDVKLNKEWIVPGIGTITSINYCLKALLNKEDSVLIFTPVYGPFRDVINGNELTLKKEPLIMEDGVYKIDFESLENRIRDEKIKSILFCSPHNPSGRVWSREELDRLVRICKENDILLIGDEVHSDLTLEEGTFISLATYADEYDNIIVSSSPNKSFNLAGLNTSYLVVLRENNKNKVENEFSKNKLSPNRMGVNCISNCYKLGEVWVNELRRNIAENIHVVENILNDCDIEIIRPKAGYLLWVKLNKVKDIQEFILNLSKETGVLLEPGNRFVENYEGYVRINVATSKEILKEGMRKFKEYYNSI